MTGSKKNILVIEDSLATSLLISEFMKKLGYQNIHTCNTGKAGIRIFSDLVNAGSSPVVILTFNFQI